MFTYESGEELKTRECEKCGELSVCEQMAKDTAFEVWICAKCKGKAIKKAHQLLKDCGVMDE